MQRAHAQIHRSLSDDLASERLNDLLEAQASRGVGLKPIEVDFLKLFEDRSGAERATHLLHPYPAKLIRNIPRFFLASDAMAAPGATVLDPFCGSGTVLLEARLRGHWAVGADANPLARLISTAKLSPPPAEETRRVLVKIIEAARTAAPNLPDVVNVDYWFDSRVKEQLARLRGALIETSGGVWESPFLWTCFSSCVRRVSRADPRLSVPVRINPERVDRYGAKGAEVLQRLKRLETVDVLQVFWQVTLANIRRAERTSFPGGLGPPAIFDDARRLELPEQTVDLVITSPPYAGAQKYVRASSLCLGWLGLSPGGKLRPIERKSIGREHLDAWEAVESVRTGYEEVDGVLELVSTRNHLRARIAATYILEMAEALRESSRVLKDGGKLVLVAGPNMVTGYEFNTPGYLLHIAESLGLRPELHLLDTIASRGLMTKRNKTAGTIAQESVYVLTKCRS